MPTFLMVTARRACPQMILPVPVEGLDANIGLRGNLMQGLGLTAAGSVTKEKDDWEQEAAW